jgi:hypothetical protein
VHAPVQSPLVLSQLTRHDSTLSHAVPVELQTWLCSALQRRELGAQVVVLVHCFLVESQLWVHTCWVIH